MIYGVLSYLLFLYFQVKALLLHQIAPSLSASGTQDIWKSCLYDQDDKRVGDLAKEKK